MGCVIEKERVCNESWIENRRGRYCEREWKVENVLSFDGGFWWRLKATIGRC